MVSQDPTVATKKKGKKRQISKHIINSKLKSKNSETDTALNAVVATPLLNSSNEIASSDQSQTKAAKRRQQVKDLLDVAGYLTAWKTHQQKHSDGVGKSLSKSIWKFNKNTQSWLMRHLYNSTKVTKTIFNDALPYFVSANDEVQQRLRHDATIRALRYQQYSSTSPTSASPQNPINTDSNDSHSQISSKLTSSESASNRNAHDANNSNISLPDDAQWILLNDHDKRKEYKRARKVLDTIAVQQSENKA
jgi:WKF domain